MVNVNTLLVAAALGFGQLASAAGKKINAQCSKNACLSAVQSGSRPSGIGACNSFFRTIVTPHATTTTITTVPTVTTTSTTTLTSSFSTTTTSTSVTTTTTAVSTSTVYTTTMTITASSTTTSVSTVSTDTTTISVFTIPSDPSCNGASKLRKRQHTSTPTKLPPYATKVCKNDAAYSSACSCIGATHTTSTRPTPTHTRIISKPTTVATVSTVTTSVTATASTATTSTSTVSTTITVSKATSTLSISTITASSTTTVFTTTFTSTVTSCPQPQATFALKVTGGDENGDDAYVSSMGDNGVITFSPNTDTPFSRDENCNLINVGPTPFTTANIDSDSGIVVSQIYLNSASDVVDPLFCVPVGSGGNPSVSSQNEESCSVPSNPNMPNVLQTCGRSLSIGTSVGAGCDPVTLTEEPLDGC